jgi:hypothetical protein
MTRLDEYNVWTRGRRGCNACINVTIYPHSIVATADPEHITPSMTKRALGKEFPRHVFYFNANGGDYIRVDADRFTDDT